jgi:2-polyprenyl-6-methoxyphenol hydroxylase-like FAD-dependent oxidoreductase
MTLLNKLTLLLVLFFSTIANSKDDLKTDVLIVGAGPAGLTLALIFEKLGVDYILIEKHQIFNPYSKAVGIHRNSMRLLNQFGVAADLLPLAMPLNGCKNFKDLHFCSEIIFNQGQLSFDKNIAISQVDVHYMIIKRLKQEVLRGYDFLNYRHQDCQIISQVQYHDQSQQIVSKYLIGADGAASQVRSCAKIDYIGPVNKEKSFGFDAKIKSELQGNQMYSFDTAGKRLVVIALPNNIFKFSGYIYGDNCEQDNLKKVVQERSGIVIDADSIEGLGNFNTQSKIASKFVNGRVVLIGDAAHTFFPMGGYAINFAIEDAFALGWRLKTNFQQSAIENYGAERRILALQAQKDANLKKESAKKISLHRRKTCETQVYQSNESQNDFQRVGDDLYHFIYSRLEDNERFVNYDFKLVHCSADDNLLPLSQEVSNDLANMQLLSLSVATYKIKSRHCASGILYLIRPDLFYKQYIH